MGVKIRFGILKRKTGLKTEKKIKNGFLFISCFVFKITVL